MADDWQVVAQFLLRNRNIREMVDEILPSISVEVRQDCDLIPSGKLYMIITSFLSHSMTTFLFQENLPNYSSL